MCCQHQHINTAAAIVFLSIMAATAMTTPLPVPSGKSPEDSCTASIRLSSASVPFDQLSDCGIHFATVTGTEAPAGTISDTVNTMPLLSTTADSKSATNDGTSLGGASVDQVRAMLQTKPYVRFRLDIRCIPPTLPLLLEQSGVTAERWYDFWSQIKLLVQEGFEGCLIAYLLIYFSVFIHVIIVIFLGVILLWAYILTPALSLLALLPMYLYQHRKQKLLVDNIATYFKDSQEAEVFQANEYALECEILPDDVNGTRLHLYILPSDMPYERFEVYNGWPTFQGWNDTYMSAQEVPMFDSVPLEDWGSFWSQLGKLYGPQMRLFEFAGKVVIVEMLALVMAKRATLFTEADVLSVVLVLGVLVQFVIGVAYLSYRYYVFLGAKTTLVYDTAVRWASQGVYMEHRRLMHLHPWLGLSERHYVYIFLLTDGTDSVEDPDDS
jgi:hypothetical protein